MGSSGTQNKTGALAQIEGMKSSIASLQSRIERNRHSLSVKSNMSKSTRDIVKRHIAEDRAAIAEYRKRIAQVRAQIKNSKR